jgi:hypothetical protein
MDYRQSCKTTSKAQLPGSKREMRTSKIGRRDWGSPAMTATDASTWRAPWTGGQLARFSEPLR